MDCFLRLLWKLWMNEEEELINDSQQVDRTENDNDAPNQSELAVET